MTGACDGCLRRGFVLDMVGPYLEIARRRPGPLRDVLALRDSDLVKAVGGRRRAALESELERFDPQTVRSGAESAGLGVVCSHQLAYPERLRDDPTAPAALYVNGDGARFGDLASAHRPAVAVVGTRRCTPEGAEMARELGRGLAAAGVTVVSGMALGIDSAAHQGALEGGGDTIAVLACGADRAYPPSKRQLHRLVARAGSVVSELPAGSRAWRWGFLARNRIIAGMAQATIVVEAADRSGSLTTAEFALELGRDVLAVPGSPRSWRAAGTNQLIRDGAALVRDAQDVLDAVMGADAGVAWRAAQGRPVAPPADLDRASVAVLSAVESGAASVDELIAMAGDGHEAVAALGELELLGLIRRLPDGSYTRRVVGERRGGAS